jgi:hypothetical protein
MGAGKVEGEPGIYLLSAITPNFCKNKIEETKEIYQTIITIEKRASLQNILVQSVKMVVKAQMQVCNQTGKLASLLKNWLLPNKKYWRHPCQLMNLICRYCMKMNVDQQIRAAAEALLTSSASSPQPTPHLRECMSDPYCIFF